MPQTYYFTRLLTNIWQFNLFKALYLQTKH